MNHCILLFGRGFMGQHKTKLLTIFLGLIITFSYSQEIPVETWRMHISYNSIRSIAFGDNKVYASADNGIMIFDRSDLSIGSYNKISGLSSAGITSLGFDESGKQLIVAYADGNLDIIRGNEITNFDRLKNSTTIVGSKKINSIQVRESLAYLAADYGLVVFDLERLEVKETWRDLGAAGETIEIYKSTFSNDSIFLATAKGVLAGDMDDNLLDFNLWKRFDQGEFSGAIQSIAAFNDKVYAEINGSGIHRYENGVWTKEVFLQSENFQSLEASSDNLLICAGAKLWKLNTSDQLDEIQNDLIDFPLTAFEDSGDKLWIGDSIQGLLSNTSGSFVSVLPDGPTSKAGYRLNFEENKLYALAGGPSSSGQPLRNMGDVSAFESGSWQNSSEAILDLVDIETSGSGTTYLASFGYGLQKKESSGTTALYDETNSPLTNLNPPGRFVNVSAIESSDNGLWVANYGATQSLKLLKSDNQWESFSFPITASRYPTDLAVDTYGYVWMVLNPALGGGILVFDYQENKYAYLTDVIGSGGLPSKAVRSIAIARDESVWVGTDEGVAYFIYPPEVFESGIDAIKPLYENRFLLKDDKVTSLTVDGGDRKWMGTERGVWLFNPTGEELVYNFTASNSPLLSDMIRDVEINSASGEVFFASDEGIVSFRSGATSSESYFQTVKIFPNPVTIDFSGTVGISGLATDATVKITDISGKLVWQTQANGGTATWNVQDYNGRRAATGIYLVFAATPDGSESVVGKLAVVE